MHGDDNAGRDCGMDKKAYIKGYLAKLAQALPEANPTQEVADTGASLSTGTDLAGRAGQMGRLGRATGGLGRMGEAGMGIASAGRMAGGASAAPGAGFLSGRVVPGLAGVGYGAQGAVNAGGFGRTMGEGNYGGATGALGEGASTAANAAASAGAFGQMMGAAAPTLGRIAAPAALAVVGVDAARSFNPEYRKAQLQSFADKPYTGSAGQTAKNFLGNWATGMANPVSGAINTVQQGKGMVQDWGQEAQAANAANAGISRLNQSYLKAGPEQRARVNQEAVNRYNLGYQAPSAMTQLKQPVMQTNRMMPSVSSTTPVKPQQPVNYGIPQGPAGWRQMNKRSGVMDVISDPLAQNVAGGTLAGLGAGALYLANVKSKQRRSNLKKALILGLYGTAGARMGLEIDMLRRVDASKAWDPRVQGFISKSVPDWAKIK